MLSYVRLYQLRATHLIIFNTSSKHVLVEYYIKQATLKHTSSKEANSQERFSWLLESVFTSSTPMPNVLNIFHYVTYSDGIVGLQSAIGRSHGQRTQVTLNLKVRNIGHCMVSQQFACKKRTKFP